jgi:D-arabinose 1-dehydrogenase-like Zn-dependent alcohol dehydrogenase
MIMDGTYISLNKLITKKFKLEQINEVYEAMTKRQIIGRWVCEFD